MMACRKMKYNVSINDILLIGENLRTRMHKDATQIIKDRRLRFRPQTSCFIGTQAIDWVIKNGLAPNRAVALRAFTILQENEVLHHVTDDQNFADDMEFYRFKKDDDSFPWHEDVLVLFRGQRLYQSLVEDKLFVMMSQSEDNVEYDDAFRGNHLVDWMVKNKHNGSRQEAVNEGKRLLQADIIHHVSDAHHFKDEDYLYQFKLDFNKQFALTDLVPESMLSVTPAIVAYRGESGYGSGGETSGSLSPQGIPYLRFSSSNVSATQEAGLLIRRATVEELDGANPQYHQRLLRIQSDPVGFGFVIRGEGPTYVKTVDPTGPAASAGLKVGHYITKVNDRDALHTHHRELAHIILEYTGSLLRLTVMEYVTNEKMVHFS